MPPETSAAPLMHAALQDPCTGDWPTFQPPEASHPSYEDWSRLRDPSRESVKTALSVCEQVWRLVREGKKETTAAKSIGRMMSWNWKKVLRTWQSYRAAGFSWKAVVDKRHEPEWWDKLEDSIILPAGVKELFKTLSEKCGDCKTAYENLLGLLDAWRRGRGAAISGYDTPPPNAPRKRHPAGWSYANLMRHGSTTLELAAGRDGREAVLKELPGVRTTRVGSYPLAEVQFDDMWHDVAIRAISGRSHGIRRVLEIGAIDHYSGYIFNPGLKTRLPDETEERMIELTEKDFRMYLAWYLTNVGWSKRGTVLNVENSKVVIREELAGVIERLTGGLVTVKKSGMIGLPALAGQFEARPKGNFRAKALKEGIGKLIHNRESALPGQVGGSFRDQPAKHHGEAEADKFLMALSIVAPQIGKLLKLNLCDIHQFKLAVLSLLYQINQRRNHEMEGWEEEQLFAREFTMDPDAAEPVWQNISVMEKWDAERRAAVEAILAKTPSMTRLQRLSPLEVFEPCLADTIRLPHCALPEIVGRDLGLKKMVDQKLFDVGGHLFLAEIRDKAGLPQQLTNGDVYHVFLNPFDLGRLIVCDEKTMAYVGECKPWKSVPRGEVEAIQDLKNEQNRLFKDAVAEATVRLGIGKGENFAANAKAIRAGAKRIEQSRPGPNQAALDRRHQQTVKGDGELSELLPEQNEGQHPQDRSMAKLVETGAYVKVHPGTNAGATAPAVVPGVTPRHSHGEEQDSDDDLAQLLKKPTDVIDEEQPF